MHAKMLGLRNNGKKSMLSESRTQDAVIAYLTREGPQDICCVLGLSIKIQSQSQGEKRVVLVVGRTSFPSVGVSVSLCN